MKGSIITIISVMLLALFIICIGYSGLSAQTKQSPVWTLNDQNTILTGKFPSGPPAALTLDAAEVEKMIVTLAQMRATMKPPRPVGPPEPGTPIYLATASRWWVQPDGTGIDLTVLHPGYGWVGLYLDQNGIEQLSQRLSRSLHKTPSRARHSSKR